VGDDDAVRELAIGDEGAKPVHLRFEAMRFFVMDDGDLAEIQVHGSPRCFAGFFIPEIAECAGRALIDLLDDAIGG
jgi:hypothetical protein